MSISIHTIQFLCALGVLGLMLYLSAFRNETRLAVAVALVSGAVGLLAHHFTA